MLRLSQIRQLLAEAIQEIGLRRNLHDPEHAAYREMALMDLQEAQFTAVEEEQEESVA